MSVHSLAEALLSLLASFPDSVIPFAQYSVALEQSNSFAKVSVRAVGNIHIVARVCIYTYVLVRACLIRYQASWKRQLTHVLFVSLDQGAGGRAAARTPECVLLPGSVPTRAAAALAAQPPHRAENWYAFYLRVQAYNVT